MLSLIRRLFPMDHDVVPTWRPRHRGRPALVARRPVEFVGATVDWSPKDEIADVDEREPEETATEARDREAEERVRHLAELDRAAREAVASELAAVLDPKLGPLFAAVDAACRAVLDELGVDDVDDLLARHQAAALQTGEYPVVRELVTV